MVSCDLCSKTFKNQAGLAGHKQFAHHAPAAALAAGQAATDQLQEQTNQSQEQLIEQQSALIEQLQEQLDIAEDHEHSATSCHQCHDLAHRWYEEGQNDGLTEALKIPGAVEAAQFSKEQQQRNNEHPDATPVLANWLDIPGVSELISEYQQHNALITIHA